MVVGGEGGGMASFSGHHGWGVRQATEEFLRRTAEVPPEGMGFRAVHKTGHRDGVIDRGGKSAQHVTPIPR